MTLLIVTILATLLVSFICSTLEGFLLSTTAGEIEALKNKHPKAGQRLEDYRTDIESSTAAILTLNTVANVAGSGITGYLAGELWGSTGVGIITSILTVVVLLFCEILPKNIGVLFRKQLQPILIPLLGLVMTLMRPIAKLCKLFVRALLPSPKHATEEEREQEVLLLVNKGLNEGIFTVTEREMISNTLRLDDRAVLELMTPLEKVVALQGDERVSSAVRRIGKILHTRFPVYEGAQMIGVVRRDELLHASALDQHDQTVKELMKPTMRLHSQASIADLLQLMLKNHQEFCIIEGSTNQTLGIVTMKDIIEHLFGRKVGAQNIK